MDYQYQMQTYVAHNNPKNQSNLGTSSIKLSFDITNKLQDAEIFPCQANTFVFLQTNSSKDYVPFVNAKHVDHKGKLIKQISLGKLNYVKCNMMTERHAIFQAYSKEQKNFSLIQWDLNTYQIIKVKCGNVLHNQVFLFSQSKLICVIQKTNKNIDYLSSAFPLVVSIKYFRFPLKSSDQSPMFKIQQAKIFNFYDEAKKINHHSGIAWVSKNDESKYLDKHLNKNLNESYVHILDLREKQIKVRSYLVDDSFNKNKNIFDTFIDDIWQIKSNVFYIRLRTQLNVSKFKNKVKKKFTEQDAENLLENERVDDFIWNPKQKAMNKLKLLTKQNPKDYIIQFSNGLRDISKIVLYKNKINPITNLLIQELKVQKRIVNVYYVNSSDKSIICIQKAENEQNKSINNQYFFYPGYNCHLYFLIQRQISLNKVNFQISFFELLPFQRKIFIAFLMTQIINNCDQALLDIVLQLIGDKAQFQWVVRQDIQMINNYEFQQEVGLLQKGKNFWSEIFKKAKAVFKPN